MTSPSEVAGRLFVRRDGPLSRALEKVPGASGRGLVPRRTRAERTVTSVCGFCSTGCGLEVQIAGDRAVGLLPSRAYPVNRGSACPKGWEALAPLDGPDRATRPLLRDASGRLAPVSWDRALAEFTSRLRDVQRRHGADAAAFLSTGQIPTEEMIFLGALAKFGMGMVHGDGNTRQCMATAVVAYQEAFGFDAPPYAYADLEVSDVVVLIGSNLCVAHPILWERLTRNPHAPEIVVIDPRRTETATLATRHVPVRPKGDLELLYSLAHVLVEEGWIDRAFVSRHTRGFEELREHLRGFAPEATAAQTGVAPAEVRALADVVRRGERVSFWWTMGVNQGHEAVAVAQAIIDLALLTGNVGRPGTGANSITGQCNAMGSRLYSNTTSLFAGRDFRNAAHRAEVARILDVPVETIPDRPSLSYDGILEAVKEGRIRALWIVATNPVHSWIDRSDLERTLGRLDFLVVQDMYASTETARRAHLVLPAAGWGEKQGTFINSERRLGLIHPVRSPPGEALPDFDVFRLVAEAWGAPASLRAWRSPEDVFQVLRELSRGRPCDVSGVTGYEMLARHGGVQWPFREGEAEPRGDRRLFADGRFFHADGRARLLFAAPRPVPEPTDSEYPLVLLTGRGSAAEWHTGTRTETSPVLRRLRRSGLVVEVNEEDARTLGIDDGDGVRLRSRRGAVDGRALLTSSLRPGQVFVSMHHPATNCLTHPSFDPRSRQPSYKHCAVRLERLG